MIKNFILSVFLYNLVTNKTTINHKISILISYKENTANTFTIIT